jgi:hypothetical protein
LKEDRTMTKLTGLSLLAALGVASAARAQSPTPQVLRACYVPVVGLVYRIGEPGLPEHCLGPKHVEFSWNATGPKGDKGDRGDPGNLALAGRTCPAGQFVTG